TLRDRLVQLRQKAVADAPDGVQVLGDRAELFAQPPHVGINGAGVDVAFVFPHVPQELIAGLDMADALDQQGEELEFGGGQLDAFALDRHQMAGDIDVQRTEDEGGLGLRTGVLFEPFLDAEYQLARTERLGDVIGRPQFQAQYAVYLAGAGGEHDDRDGAGFGIAPEQLADFQTVHFRQHQV